MRILLAAYGVVLGGCVAPEVSGFLLGAPVGVTTEEDATIRVKCAGFENPPHSICLDEPITPNFSQVPGVWLAGTPWDALTMPSPIQAMSLGIDMIEVVEIDLDAGAMLDGVELAAGETVGAAALQPGSHGWIALLYSVDAIDPDDPGPFADSVVEAGAELARSVFSYLVPGSAGDDPEEGVALRALEPADLHLYSEGDEIHALNMHMAMYRTKISAHGSFFTYPLPENPTIYFTLRPEFVELALSPGYGTLAAVFGGYPNTWAIYKSTWDPTEGTWGAPALHQANGRMQGEVIDGLAIDKVTGDRMLFSTRSAPAEGQLQYMSFSGSGAETRRRVVVREHRPDGTTVYHSAGKKLGGGRGLGDFCTQDPSAWTSLPGPYYYIDDYFVARRMDPQVAGKRELSVSGFRQGAHGREVMRTCMSWPDARACSGVATVRWGLMPSFAAWLPIAWQYSRSIPYVGEPLVADFALPDATPSPDVPRSVVAQWTLRAGGRKYVGPLSVLRY